MRYKVVKEISFEITSSEEYVIPEGTILYKIPGDHMGNEKYIDYYNWNGMTVKLDRDTDSLVKL